MGSRTFWDFCAPMYDIFEKVNGRAYSKMLETVRGLVPSGSTVLEVAAGTGAISLAVANRASHVLCSDISEAMLRVARHKALRHGARNLTIANRSIYGTGETDAAFDVVIAGQVLHLIDTPEKAAAELRRVAKKTVILPMSFTKNLRGTAKWSIGLYRLFGFAPKREFDAESYAVFLADIGFANCKFIDIAGRIPMTVAVWHKKLPYHAK